MSSPLVKGLHHSILQSLSFETSPGKAFFSSAQKAITKWWGSLNTISAESHNPVVLSAALDLDLESCTLWQLKTTQGGKGLLKSLLSKKQRRIGCRGVTWCSRQWWKISVGTAFSLTQAVSVRKENPRRTKRSNGEKWNSDVLYSDTQKGRPSQMVDRNVFLIMGFWNCKSSKTIFVEPRLNIYLKLCTI